MPKSSPSPITLHLIESRLRVEDRIFYSDLLLIFAIDIIIVTGYVGYIARAPEYRTEDDDDEDDDDDDAEDDARGPWFHHPTCSLHDGLHALRLRGEREQRDAASRSGPHHVVYTSSSEYIFLLPERTTSTT